jgi:ATP-dependent exoDNAse (exonuclease V) alpha subunit
MFVKNDTSIDKNYFNGKMGVIKSLSSQEILVFSEEDKTIEVEKYEWQNIRYKVDQATGNRGRGFRNLCPLPIKLAWAITVHKVKV